jgi:hypothetical protein
MLLASTEANQGDLQVVTPAQVLAKVNEQRAQLDRIEALANEYAARVVIPAFVEAYGIELVESDVPDGVQALADIEPAGSLHVVVPQGQTAIVRLAAIRDLIVHLQTKADAA